MLHQDSPVALCRVEEQWYALDGTCPHRGGPLGHGAVEGRHVLCPWHLWAFDCTTGENDFNSDCRVRTYPVQVAGLDVLVDFA